ncbi:Tail-specific protease precursor [Kluyvera cryocrescens]|uniref:Tail-specific protease n=1 Tax=Kluyvera cryocrescens TaxID=580 RepID=A0A485A7Z7_KLUCR|nr:Tail-specific protease precursor [Kluyvera cryocrescens]
MIGWRLDDVVALIKGPKGSKVRLEVLPAGKGSKTRIVTLTRERIRLEDRAVKMSVKNVGKDKVGVLDIPGFYVGLDRRREGSAAEAGKTERQQRDHRFA